MYFVNGLICTVFFIILGMKKSGNYTACVPCTVLITNGKRITIN